MKEMMNLNFRWFMQTLLDRKDRMSMYSSLEVRVPFCDYRIADYLYRVPWSYKDHNGMEKGLLRHAVRGLLPDEVLHRKKSPYPKTHHPEYTSGVIRRMAQILNDPHSPILQIIDRQAMEALMQSDLSPAATPWFGQLMTGAQMLAYLIQVNAWMLRYRIEPM